MNWASYRVFPSDIAVFQQKTPMGPAPVRLVGRFSDLR